VTDASVSPLRQRMIEEMTIRKLAPPSQEGATQAREQAVQRPSQRDRSDRAHPCPRVRQQPGFWLNEQRRSDLWEATHSPRERERIKRARPLTAAA
jgi:hypothetical protein